MHTFIGPNGTTFTFNSDHSGSVGMRVKDDPSGKTYWFSCHDVIFFDWVIPDMKFNTYASDDQSAQVQITIYTAMYPNGTVRTYGPYTFTSGSTYINTRGRGRLMKIRIESDDAGSWWRIGAPKLRIAQSGTR